MPVGFGFSVGDLISGSMLIKELINALNDASGSSAEYRKLICELQNLQSALETLQDLRVDESRRDQRFKLEQVAAHCLKTIEDFVTRCTKFDAHLATSCKASKDTVLKWKTALKKVQWAFTKRDDVLKLRAEIMGHTSTINILMSSIQLSQNVSDLDKLEELRKSSATQQEQITDLHTLMEKSVDQFHQNTDLLRAQCRRIHQLEQENRETRGIVLRVLHTGKQVFSMISGIQKLFLRYIPPQISQQQPVYLEDVLGRVTPFHIEWVNSREVRTCAFLSLYLKAFKLTMLMSSRCSRPH